MKQVYASYAQIAELTGWAYKTVQKNVRTMRKLIPIGIYAERDFLGTHVRVEAYEHFKRHEKQLLTWPEDVDPFTPKEGY